MRTLTSKMPKVATSIFSVMSKLALECHAINLSQGFPDYEADQKLKDLYCHYIQDNYNQYAPMPGVPALLEQISLKIQKSYSWAPEPISEITITTGASQAICSAIGMIISPGDEAIVIEPAYDSYIPAIRMNSGIPLVYEMRAPDFKVDWEAVEQLVSSKTKLLIINNPHNPTGTVYTESDLKAIEQLCEKHDLWLLSDEVYEHLVYHPHRHHSILEYPALRARGMAVFSFGKSLHATGWKLGYIIAPEALTSEFRKVHQFTVFCVNTPAQYAVADYLQSKNDWSDLSLFFETKKNYLEQGLSEGPLKPLSCAGTYFQLYDYSDFSDLDDVAFAKWLTTKYGVATIPLSPFYSSGLDQKLLRICFAKKEETLKKAIHRLEAI
jgi:methionine aminotransferase